MQKKTKNLLITIFSFNIISTKILSGGIGKIQ